MNNAAASIGKEVQQSPFSKKFLLLLSLRWILAYVLVTLFTGSFFMADTVDYVTSALRHEQGAYYEFWDFRHLFWRPLGWFLFHVLKSWVPSANEADARASITLIFLSLNWIAGLFSLLLLFAFLSRRCHKWWAVEFATLCFLLSQGFLNYVHSGSSYIPGLALLTLGVYLITRGADELPSTWAEFSAALALALAVCLWFPYVFAVPGILALPLFQARRNWRFSLETAIFCLLLGVAGYGLVIIHLGIHTVPDLLHWINSGAGDVAGVRGLNRAVFGLARSFLNMGDDGVLYKRFLLHDPYNPVPLAALVRVSLFKIGLFYLLLLLVTVQLWRSVAGRRVMALCVAASAPVFVFALFWYGGDVERYLPLYPFFFLGLAFALGHDKSPALLKWMSVAYLLTAAIVNLAAMSQSTLRIQQNAAEDRVRDLLQILRPGSRIVVVDIHDELVNFYRTFPLNPVNRGRRLVIYAVLNPGTPQTDYWQQELASTVFSIWSGQGDVWVSKRVFYLSPRRNWSWVEGSDPHLTWNVFHKFFSQFDFGDPVGGEDGFVLLPPTKKNCEILSAQQQSKKTNSVGRVTPDSTRRR